jgi:hypothetical protein
MDLYLSYRDQRHCGPIAPCRIYSNYRGKEEIRMRNRLGMRILPIVLKACALNTCVFADLARKDKNHLRILYGIGEISSKRMMHSAIRM